MTSVGQLINSAIIGLVINVQEDEGRGVSFALGAILLSKSYLSKLPQTGYSPF